MVLLVGCTGRVSAPPSAVRESADAIYSPSASASELSTAVRHLELGQVVDGVPCLDVDLPGQHIHVHLQILHDGVEVPVPPGIGIGQPWQLDSTGFIVSGGCFAWIHVHDASGVVHIVAPVEDPFTLGQVFAVWGQFLAANSALGYHGSVVLLVNGQRVHGDPSALALANLQNIVLELGEPPAVPPPALYDFSTTRL